MPTEEDIHIAYRDYYTHGAHSGETKPTMAGQIYRRMKEEYCAKHYGYERPSAHVSRRGETACVGEGSDQVPLIRH